MRCHSGLQSDSRYSRYVAALHRDPSFGYVRRPGRIRCQSKRHRLPGDTPEIDTNLQPGELITSVDLPASASLLPSTYRKVRDRASYAFALVSVAAAMKVESGIIREIRLALGGVAHKPWRASVAEQLLRGGPAAQENFVKAAAAELAPAIPRRGNAFKIELAKRTIVLALSELSDGAKVKGGAQ
jgi:xanthine dehydrogenase YagS FAD-binding subunit